MLWGTQPVSSSDVGDCGSPTLHERPTSLVYQPLEPSVPLTEGETPGADGSTMP